jgi:transcription antitermination protein NusB
MISRRSIRIKVMQTMFAQVFDANNGGVVAAKNQLETSIIKTIEINLVYLLYFVRIFEYFKEYNTQQMSKYLISDEERKVNQSLLESPIVQYIATNEIFLKYVKKYHTEYHIDESIIKDSFVKLYHSEEYKTYNEIASPTLDDQKVVFQYIIKAIFSKDEELHNHLEGSFINVENDTELVCFSLKRSIKNFDINKQVNFELGFTDWDTEKDYAYNLLSVSISQMPEYMKLIEPKLKGWEMDRIAKMDMVIMYIALSEMLHFPNIPLKVTMNEFVDITKMYSTPKSKEFVNGVLDRLMKDLKSEGKILKTGRGLEE